MTARKKSSELEEFVPDLKPVEPAQLVERIEQEKPPGKYEVVVEDYVADGPSQMEGPTIVIDAPPAPADNEFGVDLSHLTPSARERVLMEMREGRRRVEAIRKGG